MEIIRYESPFDYGEVFDLWSEIFGIEEARLEELQVNGSESQYNKDFVYVAKEGDTLLGIVHTTIPVGYPEFCGFAGVCTTKEARGKGVAKALFRKAVEDADEMGVKTSFLGTGNMIAAKLYGQNGFEFYPGTYMMYRQKDGKIIDFLNQSYGSDIGEIKIIEGNQSFRIPIVPLVLDRTSTICDINTNIVMNPFVQARCMSLYPQYLKLKENGGKYFGAVSEQGLLGAMASVLQNEEGICCDFFFNGAFEKAVPQLIEKCTENAKNVFFQIADCDKEKIKIVEELGYSAVQTKDYVYNGCVIATKIYRKA